MRTLAATRPWEFVPRPVGIWTAKEALATVTRIAAVPASTPDASIAESAGPAVPAVVPADAGQQPAGPAGPASPTVAENRAPAGPAGQKPEKPKRLPSRTTRTPELGPYDAGARPKQCG